VTASTGPELRAILDRWERTGKDLVELVRSIDRACWALPGPYPGWTNRDLLTHLATGYSERLVMLTEVISGVALRDLPGTDARNSTFIESYRHINFKSLVTAMIRTRRTVRDLMKLLTTEQLERVVDWGSGPTSVGSILLDFSQHDLEHAQDLARNCGVEPRWLREG